MKKIKAIFKSLGGRVWFSVSAVLIAILIVVTVLTTGTFHSVVNTVLGGKRPILDPTVEATYESEYKSKAEVLEAGNKLNVQIQQEGAVLLLNEEIAKNKRSLPIAKGAKVKNCVLMQDTVVEEGVSLEYIISDKNVSFTAGKELRGSDSFPVYVAKHQTV